MPQLRLYLFRFTSETYYGQGANVSLHFVLRYGPRSLWIPLFLTLRSSITAVQTVHTDGYALLYHLAFA
jgi:hypothetical protein